MPQERTGRAGARAEERDERSPLTMEMRGRLLSTPLMRPRVLLLTALALSLSIASICKADAGDAGGGSSGGVDGGAAQAANAGVDPSADAGVSPPADANPLLAEIARAEQIQRDQASFRDGLRARPPTSGGRVSTRSPTTSAKPSRGARQPITCCRA